MDDIPEKTRRNLVVYSATLFAFSALDIPLDGKLLGIVELKHVQPATGWAVAMLVLLYLWLRYRLAPDNTKGTHEHIAATTEAWSNYLHGAVQRAFERKLAKLVPEGVEFEPLPSPPSDLATPGAVNAINFASQRGGTVTFEWKNQGPAYGTRETLQTMRYGHAKFTVSRGLYYKARLRRRLMHYQLSWPMLEYVVPKILALLAAVACVGEFVQAIGWLE